MEPGRRDSLLAAFVGLIRDEVSIGEDKTIPRNEYVRGQPRFAFWIAATVILADLYAKKDLAERFAKGSLTLGELILLPGMRPKRPVA